MRTRKITEKDLRKAINEHLIKSDVSDSGSDPTVPRVLSKQKIRELHEPHRRAQREKGELFLKERGLGQVKNFAAGTEIDPRAISPALIEVSPNTPESDLFRFATFLWSIPVSQGFGRRLRFIVKDMQNDKLIGLFALGDPVFSLAARDAYIGWTFEDRKTELVHVMDAFVVGAVPPYSQIIGGKLVAALMTSSEVKKAYERKYLDQTSVISGIAKRARLVLITTTSALGRSSLYNRLSIPNGPSFTRVGTTRGYGHFQISDELFDLMRRYLEQKNHPYASGNRFGMGQNWRFRVVRTALEDVGLSADDVLKHGVEREVYLIPLAKNWRQILLGTNKNVYSVTQQASEISKYCLERWMLPRSERDPRYQSFDPDSIMPLIFDNGFHK